MYNIVIWFNRLAMLVIWILLCLFGFGLGFITSIPLTIAAITGYIFFVFLACHAINALQDANWSLKYGKPD